MNFVFFYQIQISYEFYRCAILVTLKGEACEQSTSLEFWERFLRCILTLVEEDLVYFSPIFQSILPEFDLVWCSAEKNWEMLLGDLVGFLEHENECRHWASISDYMKLQV